MSTTVNIRKLSALEGVNWIRRAFELIKINPWMISSSFFLYLLILILVQQLPIIGAFLPGLLVPPLFFGVMAVLQAVAQRQRPSLAIFFSGFLNTISRTRLLVSGVIYSLGFIIAIAVSSLADGGVMFRNLVLGEAMDPAQAQLSAQTGAQLLALIAFTPTAACFWISPQLIVWHGMSVSKALFFSFFFFFRNLAAITTFFLTIATLLVGFALIVSALAYFFATPNLAINIMLPISLFVFVIIYSGFYASYESLVEVKPSEQ